MTWQSCCQGDTDSKFIVGFYLFGDRLSSLVLSPNGSDVLTHSSPGCRWHATSMHVTVAPGPSTVTGAEWQPWFICRCFPGKHMPSNPPKKLTHSQLRQLQINFNLEHEIWIWALYPCYKIGITDNISVPARVVSDMTFLLPKNMSIRHHLALYCAKSQERKHAHKKKGVRCQTWMWVSA